MAMLGERPPRSVDEAVVIGEWLSAAAVFRIPRGRRHTGRSRKCARRGGHRRHVRQRLAADGADRREVARPPASAAATGNAADRHRIQRRYRRRPSDHAGPRRLRFFRFDSGGRAGCHRALDLDRRGRHHERRSAPGTGRAGAGRNYLRRSGGTGLQWRQSAASPDAGAAGRQEHPGVEQEQLRYRRSPGRRSCPRSPRWPAARVRSRR